MPLSRIQPLVCTKHIIDPEIETMPGDDALHASVMIYLGREGLH